MRINGSLIIEILGPENAAKADALAQKLRETLKDEARISRPTAMGELQVWNIDDTVDPEDVRNVIFVTGIVIPRMLESVSSAGCSTALTRYGLNARWPLPSK